MQSQPDTMMISDLLELKSNEMLVANPEYQRGVVWTKSQKKRLVDSVLRGYPIPLIYLHLVTRQAGGLKREGFEVIDGQQRIASLHEFKEGAFKLFDPVTDEAEARFPDFVKKQPCPWGGKDWKGLPENIQSEFLGRKLSIVKVTTQNENEARDLFVRLQAGMPLNSQEKRDAWPGQFTDFVLKMGGKPGLVRYPGHDFFGVLMKANKASDRGKFRQFAAQIAMLYLTKRRSAGERLCDIDAGTIDDFYYENLGFDAESTDAKRLTDILDKAVDLFRDQKRKKLIGHEAMHIVLLLDSLWDDYTRSWEATFAASFDHFREAVARANGTRYSANPSDFWLRYGQLTRTNSDRSDTIRRRHEFFVSQMWLQIQPRLKDPKRLYGELEREIIYYRDRKLCGVCDADVLWDEADIHHVERHSDGGSTTLENGALVHRHCHPKSEAATTLFEKHWKAKQQSRS